MRHGDFSGASSANSSSDTGGEFSYSATVPAAKGARQAPRPQPGQRPKSDRLAPKVLALVADGRSYRPIARELDLSKNTVLEIVKRNRATSTES